jgi:hypothetical protein
MKMYSGTACPGLPWVPQGTTENRPGRQSWKFARADGISPYGVSAANRQVSSQPEITCETITTDSRKESRRPYPIPIIAVCCEKTISAAGGLSRHRSAGRQLPVVSAFTRAKDSFTTVRCHTRSLSQIRQSNHPAPQRDFLCQPASPRSQAFSTCIQSNCPRRGFSSRKAALRST